MEAKSRFQFPPAMALELRPTNSREGNRVEALRCKGTGAMFGFVQKRLQFHIWGAMMG